MADETELLTRLLRDNDESPFWTRLRSLLRERGIAPEAVALVFSVEEGEMDEFGILVLPSGQAVEFNVHSDSETWENGTFTEWANLSEDGGSFAREVARGREYLGLSSTAGDV